MANRIFVVKKDAKLILYQEEVQKNKSILEEFGWYTFDLQITGKMPSEAYLQSNIIAFIELLWVYLNPNNLRRLIIHPINLKLPPINFFSSNITKFRNIEELDFTVPFLNDNGNGVVLFNIHCPRIRILRIAGPTSINWTIFSMPTTLHTLQITFNSLIEEYYLRQLISFNPGLKHLHLKGVTEIYDLNKFIQYLISIDLHVSLETLELQLRRIATTYQPPHVMYTLKPFIQEFVQLKKLDIAGFGNLATIENVRTFEGIQKLEVLIISSPLWDLAMEVSKEFLDTFAVHVPPNLRELWIKRMIVKRTNWDSFTASLENRCNCHLLLNDGILLNDRTFF